MTSDHGAAFNGLKLPSPTSATTFTGDEGPPSLPPEKASSGRGTAKTKRRATVDGIGNGAGNCVGGVEVHGRSEGGGAWPARRRRGAAGGEGAPTGSPAGRAAKAMVDRRGRKWAEANL